MGDMRIKGKITSWHDDKGYGFVTPLAGGKTVFIGNCAALAWLHTESGQSAYSGFPV